MALVFFDQFSQDASARAADKQAAGPSSMARGSDQQPAAMHWAMLILGGAVLAVVAFKLKANLKVQLPDVPEELETLLSVAGAAPSRPRRKAPLASRVVLRAGEEEEEKAGDPLRELRAIRPPPRRTYLPPRLSATLLASLGPASQMGGAAEWDQPEPCAAVG